jgi:hypothetical protein
MARKVVEADGEIRLIIEMDESGRVTSAKDTAGKDAEKGDAKTLKLNGKKILAVSDGTTIKTEGSTCVWYFVGGNWYRVCW